MQLPAVCEGIPRDLGVAQGEAFTAAIRGRVGPAGLLDGWRSLPAELARFDRALWRHHPQLAERLSGLALGARVSRRELLAVLAEVSAKPSGEVALAAPPAVGAPLLARLCARVPVLRVDRPDGGIPALVAAEPWLPTVVCGVNEAGLAVAISAPEPADGPPAPVLPLVGDCLARFRDVGGAMDWCQKRPAVGAVSVLAVDASGAAAGVAFSGAERSRVEPEAGVLVGSGPSALREALAKAWRESTSGGLEVLRKALADAAPTTACVWLDPAARTLGVDGPDGSAFQFSLSASS